MVIAEVEIYKLLCISIYRHKFSVPLNDTYRNHFLSPNFYVVDMNVSVLIKTESKSKHFSFSWNLDNRLCTIVRRNLSSFD